MFVTCLLCQYVPFATRMGASPINYKELLRYQNQLKYDFGRNHRPARKVFPLIEVHSFKPNLLSPGVFQQTENMPCSGQTLQFVLWKYFPIFC